MLLILLHIQADPTKKAQIFDRAKMVVALVFFVEHISETGKSRVHTTPAMVLFFFDRKISLASTDNNITTNYSGSHISRQRARIGML
jgi:hypothetical protein